MDTIWQTLDVIMFFGVIFVVSNAISAPNRSIRRR